MIASGGPLRHRLVEVGLQPVALAVDDALREPLEQRQLGQLLGARLAFDGRGGDALEHAP